MIRLFTALLAALALSACSTQKEPPRKLAIAKVGVLPLALSDDFEIRKVSQFFHDPRDPLMQKITLEPMLQFERARMNFGAVSSYDRAERYGHYFYTWWRAKRDADITVRLEYRQENLGSHVLAKEEFYPAAKGSHETKFTVIGDEYSEEGRITAWRLLLIENGHIVGVWQSFLWN